MLDAGHAGHQVKLPLSNGDPAPTCEVHGETAGLGGPQSDPLGRQVESGEVCTRATRGDVEGQVATAAAHVDTRASSEIWPASSPAMRSPKASTAGGSRDRR